jgi:hypothetical protein
MEETRTVYRILEKKLLGKLTLEAREVGRTALTCISGRICCEDGR